MTLFDFSAITAGCILALVWAWAIQAGGNKYEEDEE